MKIENQVSNIEEMRDFLQLASAMQVPDDAVLDIRRKRQAGAPWTFSLVWEQGASGAGVAS